MSEPFPRLFGFKVSPKNVTLIGTAVAAGIQAARLQTKNPTAALILGIMTAVLTTLVEPPRNILVAHDRTTLPALRPEELARLEDDGNPARE